MCHAQHPTDSLTGFIRTELVPSNHTWQYNLIHNIIESGRAVILYLFNIKLQISVLT